jgi:small subunit ribosomal protein S5
VELEERVVDIWRCSATVKGGRRFSFAAMVIVGSGNGLVGWGYGKAREVPLAIEKAMKDARKKMVSVDLVGHTIPHPVRGRYGSAKVALLPAAPGTGIIAGSAVRAVCECAGIGDILTKSFGSNNGKNLVKATFEGLMSLRSKERISRLRGVGL